MYRLPVSALTRGEKNPKDSRGEGVGYQKAPRCISHVDCGVLMECKVQVDHAVDVKVEYEARLRRTVPANATLVGYQTKTPTVLAVLTAAAAEPGCLGVAVVESMPADLPGQPERHQYHLLLV